MKRIFSKKSIAVYFLFFVVAASQAAEPNIATQQDATCASADDSLDIGYRFTNQALKNAGLCVDSAKFRPIKNLSFSNENIYFENYLHEQKFWKANLTLAPDLVETVYFQIIRFPVLKGVEAAHTQLRFALKPGSLSLSNNFGEEKINDDILISFEAGFPKGEQYNFALGALDAYSILTRVISTKQKYNQNPQNKIEQYELKLNAEDRLELLKKALQRADLLGNKYFYNTLKPNCTTEAFDLLDSLPSVKGRAEPFLTMLSLDPVAGPSIEGLKKRGLLAKRVQDFNDELNGVRTELAIPDPKPFLQEYFPTVKDYPWTLVLIQPEDSELSASEQNAVKVLRKKIFMAIPSLLQTYGSALLLKNEKSDTKQLLAKSLATALSELPNYIRKLDSSLPTKKIWMHAYFAPLKTNGGSGNIQNIDAPIELPFLIKEYKVLKNDNKSQAVFGLVADGVLQASREGAKDSKYAFLAGAGLTVELQRGASKVTSQLITGVNGGTYPVSLKNPQVDLSQLVIPHRMPIYGHVLSVLTHSQDVQKVIPNPDVTLDFGSIYGLVDQSHENDIGRFQLFEKRRCVFSPRLKGKFASQATGINLLNKGLAGENVQFHIMGTSIDLSKNIASNTIVRISAVGLNCLKIKDIEDKFGNEISKTLQSSADNLKNGDLIRRYFPFF